MSKTANSSWETTGKPIVVLTVISLIVSLLLALVNGMTAPVIKENTRRTTLAAYVSVMPSVSDAATLEEVTDYTTANVTGLRISHRQGEGSGHCGIYRVTALFENVDAHMGCQRIHGRHHTVGCPHGMKNIFLHAIRYWRSRWRVGRHAKCPACHQRGDGDPAQKRWFHHYCSPGEGIHIPRLSLVHNS